MALEICILAGGKSSRMGRDKAALKLGGATLLQIIEGVARQLGSPVRVQKRDLQPGLGPLGGMSTAFRRGNRHSDAILFLSCDMPFISPELLRALLKSAAPPHAVFTRTAAGAGFPCLLRLNHAPQLERQIARRELSLQRLARALRAKRFDPPSQMAYQLRNMNTPAEWAEARAEWKRRAEEPMNDTVLSIENLSIRRDRTVILDQIHWSLKRGQHAVILGANGSGKTSLLSALTGYLMPTAGGILVLGKRYGRTDWRELRKEIGLVSSSLRQMMADSEPGLFTVVSGKTATIDLWQDPSPAEMRQGRKLLRQIGCEHLADRPWAYLSQGERQRILIARALMAKPALLILDEPCAGLDPVARENFLNFLQELGASKRSPTLILVTHHVEEIMPAFSEVLLLKEGRKLASGPKAKVLTSSWLAETFQRDLRLRQHKERYHLQVTPNPRAVL